MMVKIVPDTNSRSAGKLADAELHFDDGPFCGLKLIAFGVWESRADGRRKVTFPARQYSVNGDRRSFSLPRPIRDEEAQDRCAELVLAAYRAHEEKQGGD